MSIHQGKINKELLKGSLEILLLSVLKQKSLYGYLIVKELKSRSDEVFSLGEGTLYPLLHKLEIEGLLESWWQEVDGRRRKYYSLTNKGKKVLAEKAAEWQAFAEAVKKVM
ncbi:MAG: helix-turn-helix transcriptional regulator [Candidatus Kerfeldbacteria bacterium]|nr:helix-turn-helix transcriptional regulator [Candidatus Kerfeldbacteria bacterium]